MDTEIRTQSKCLNCNGTGSLNIAISAVKLMDVYTFHAKGDYVNNKIKTIKGVRDGFGLSLVSAKRVVEQTHDFLTTVG